MLSSFTGHSIILICCFQGFPWYAFIFPFHLKGLAVVSNDSLPDFMHRRVFYLATSHKRDVL